MQFAIFRISILPPFFLPSYLPMIIACHSSLLSLHSSQFPFRLSSSFLLPVPPIKARRRRLNPASTGGGGESRRAGVGEEKACRARLIARRSRPERGRATDKVCHDRRATRPPTRGQGEACSEAVLTARRCDEGH